ncbi:MAG: DUF5911 domain-containing protein, partial [Rhodospirillaceae bacterium]|nr:DUF5911 domain-containing protein [Rhodospirillaceae bacterium]
MSSSLELAVIGNSTISALLDQEARIVWGCFPRFDADPTFCALLDEDGAGGSGFYEVSLFGLARTEQRYRRNSAIVITTLHDDDGNAVEITDFAPRFKQFGRVFRPTMLVRHVRPVAGTPRIRIRLRPAFEHGAGRPERTRGSNHIRYVMPDLTLRLTTDAPVSYIDEEIAFVLESPITMILGPDESLTQSVAQTGKEFFERT